MERDNTINTSDREYGVIWRYLPDGRVTHALGAGIYGHAMFSVCGVQARPFSKGQDWHGTGNQTEYERAAELPRCRRCSKILAPSVAFSCTRLTR